MTSINNGKDPSEPTRPTTVLRFKYGNGEEDFVEESDQLIVQYLIDNSGLLPALMEVQNEGNDGNK